MLGTILFVLFLIVAFVVFVVSSIIKKTKEAFVRFDASVGRTCQKIYKAFDVK